MQGERKFKTVGLYRTLADAKAVAELTICKWMDSINFGNSAYDNYWDPGNLDLTDDEMNLLRMDKTFLRQKVSEWLRRNISDAFEWIHDRAAHEVEILKYKNPFDDGDFHEYFVEVRPMSFASVPGAYEKQKLIANIVKKAV